MMIGEDKIEVIEVVLMKAEDTKIEDLETMIEIEGTVEIVMNEDLE